MKISFPAMKGNMGKRDFYVAMIKLSLIPKIFSYHDWAELPPEQRAQRVLQKSRIPEITQYILDNEDGYLFSSLTASYNGEEVFRPSVESHELGILELPLDSQFVINDGQHRMAAIVEALKQNPLLASETISVVFFPFEDLDRMQQMFSDLNRTVKITTKSLNILYDHRDLLGQLVLDAVEKVSVFKNMVDKDRVSLPLRSPKLFTLSAVYDASRELVSVVTPENQDEKAEIIKNYWEAVGVNIRQWRQVQRGELKPSELRSEYVHSHAVVLWGIGAMGRTLIQEYPSDWQSKLTRLADIDWRRTNKEWQGVCMQGTDIVNRRQSRKDTASFLKNKMELLLQPRKEREDIFKEIVDLGKRRGDSGKKSGKDLSLEFLELLKKQGAIYEVLERKKGYSPKVIRVNQNKCLIAHANLSQGRYWFGFRPEDITVDGEYGFVILLCGDNKLEKKYRVPHEEFKQFVLKGKLQEGKDYPDYQVTIFPNRGYIMKVTGNPNVELDMDKYQVENWNL
ncbi:MAG: DNA sulfur modification protein DndB [Nitrospirae bacterium]|nr:DNA sulfur modification protein DndB [Nitrospirota bacterium]